MIKYERRPVYCDIVFLHGSDDNGSLLLRVCRLDTVEIDPESIRSPKPVMYGSAHFALSSFCRPLYDPDRLDDRTAVAICYFPARLSLLDINISTTISRRSSAVSNHDRCRL